MASCWWEILIQTTVVQVSFWVLPCWDLPHTVYHRPLLLFYSLIPTKVSAAAPVTVRRGRRLWPVLVGGSDPCGVTHALQPHVGARPGMLGTDSFLLDLHLLRACSLGSPHLLLVFPLPSQRRSAYFLTEV
jgi:hypothetical protein